VFVARVRPPPPPPPNPQSPIPNPQYIFIIKKDKNKIFEKKIKNYLNKKIII
jgi:hypothetical protein